MKRKKFIALIFSLIICSPGLFASIDSGESGWIILRKLEPIRPRAIVSAAKIQGELSGIFYNPAVLSTIEQKELFLLGEKGFMETNFMAVTMGFPTGRGGVSIAGALYDAGKMKLYWLEGSTLKEKEVIAQRDVFGSVAYARKIGGRLGLGTSVKFVQSEIAEYKKATCFAADCGLLLEASDKLNLSVAVRNVGSSTEFEEKKSDLPLAVSGGLYSKILAGDIFVSFGLNGNYIVKDKELFPEIGMEFGKGLLSLNIGYRSKVKEGKLNIGFGIVGDTFDFGYKYSVGDYLEGRHIFGVGIKWGAAGGVFLPAGVDDETARMWREEGALMKKHFKKATALYNEENFGEAIVEWEKVLEIDPEHEPSRRKIKKAQRKISLLDGSKKLKKRDNVAVLDFKAINISAADATAISEFVRGALVNVEKFNVLERSNIDRILAEQGFQQTGCTTQECAVQIGKILNVQKTIIGSVSKVGGTYFITANVVVIETSKIIISKRVKFSDLANVDQAVDKLIHILVRRWK